MLPPLVVLLGPTGVGKSALALELCLVWEGEIVSADSRLIYRGMDLGTAKPTPAEQARVRHHLLDLVRPDEPLTLAEYQARAYAAIDEIHHRGRLPFLVGGTGLYVRAVVEGWQIPRVPPDPARRAERLRQPAEALHAELAARDPAAAARILPGNARRIVRALEVIEATGRRMSDQQQRRPPPYRILQLGLDLPREELYRRIDARIDAMVAAGLEAEVRRLLAAGHAFDLPAMTGLGYREFGLYVRGEISLTEAVRLLRSNTRKFVRHQANWFRRDDPRIHWLDARAPDLVAQASQQIAAFLKETPDESLTP